ncbi:MAG: Na+/H+ antiporter subunit E [Pseudomonadota bacterium]
MGRTIIAASGLVALWLLMSGIYDKMLILVFGAVSVFLSVWVSKRMDIADGERLEYPLRIVELAKYLFWLLVEIAKSNWAVSKIILSGKTPDRTNLFWAPISQKTDMCQVIYANSITLTPGTISVETEGEHFLVHAIDFKDGDMEALAEMDARVTAIEKQNAGGAQ